MTCRRSLSRALEHFSAVPVVVTEPFLSHSRAENGGKSGFWAASRPFFCASRLKPVRARCRPIKNGVAASCWGPSRIFVVVRRNISLRSWCRKLSPRLEPISAVGYRGGSRTAIGTAENYPMAQKGVNTQAGPPCHIRVTHIGAWALKNRSFQLFSTLLRIFGPSLWVC